MEIAAKTFFPLFWPMPEMMLERNYDEKKSGPLPPNLILSGSEHSRPQRFPALYLY